VTASSAGFIASRRRAGVCWGRSRKRRKFTCFDQRYVSPRNAMSFPLFSQVAIDVKKSVAGSSGPVHRSGTTGGRVFFHAKRSSGTGESAAPRFSP
jgi:hypothetical protein